MPFDPILKVRRLDARRTKQDVDPLLFSERSSRLKQLLQVHIRHLNRLQIPQQEGGPLLILFEEIFQGDDAPNPAHEKLLKLLDDGTRDFNSTHTQIAE